MGQFVDVNTACRNISCHQGADVAALETCQRLCASGLAFIAVQGHGVDAALSEVFGHVVGAKFSSGEHQHLAPVVLIDDVREQGFLFATAHGVNHLGNALHRGVARRDLNTLWIFQQAIGQFSNVIAEGGGEQQALFVFGY